MPIHVQTWSGSGSARITDMTEAGQRGRSCRVLRLAGVLWDEGHPLVREDPIKLAAVRGTQAAMRLGLALDSDATRFDDCRARCLRGLLQLRH